ncbi:MAG: TonB-dependent receptor [Anaeromyxobacter sp.]
MTDEGLRGTHAAASWEAGSFGTQRLTLAARHLFTPSGLFLRAEGFLDRAENDYPMTVQDVQLDEEGHVGTVRVRRFHDAYAAGGGSAELGLVDRSWARRLLLRFHANRQDKEIPHSPAMTVPYGEVTYAEQGVGTTLRYEAPAGRRLAARVLLGAAATRGHFLDVSACVYDWYGRCVTRNETGGEIGDAPHDQLLREQALFGRVELGWRLHPDHQLRLFLAPTAVRRTGDERLQTTASDPLSGRRDLRSLVSGLEYEADLVEGRLEAIAFLKHYLQEQRAQELVAEDTFAERDRTIRELGGGAALRFDLAPGLRAKASYERATRLPGPDEVFGDGVLVHENLELRPEVSHNLNLALQVERGSTGAGALVGEAGAFLRDADDLIILLGINNDQSYQNVYSARSVGVQGALRWTAPGDWLELDASGTYQDFRNTSDTGTFARQEGDRIPNRPYLFGAGGALVRWAGLRRGDDELSLSWTWRYVHEFYRTWESLGQGGGKQVIPSQFVQGLSAGYRCQGGWGALSVALEAQNLTDAAAYDTFGVPRPGRGFYLKTTLER